MELTPEPEDIKPPAAARLQIPLEMGKEGDRPANLVLDWMDDDDGLLTVPPGLPRGVWRRRSDPIPDWRIPVPRDADLDALTFAPTDDVGLPGILRIDEEETEAL